MSEYAEPDSHAEAREEDLRLDEAARDTVKTLDAIFTYSCAACFGTGVSGGTCQCCGGTGLKAVEVT